MFGVLIAFSGALSLKCPVDPGLVCPQVKPSDTPSANTLQSAYAPKQFGLLDILGGGIFYAKKKSLIISELTFREIFCAKKTTDQ
jgi:hypothetical protein